MWPYVVSGLLSFFTLAAGITVMILQAAGQIRFAHGSWALTLLIIPLVIVLLILKEQRRRAVMEQLGSPAILHDLMPGDHPGLRLAHGVSLTAAVTFSVLALLGPQMGTSLETVHRKGVDIILAVDTSRSMDADDIKPSRMIRAKLQIGEFLDSLSGDRVGLIAFAGDAFIQCPLTLDYGAARVFLDILDTSLIPTPGTDIGRAIEVTRSAFSERERKHKALILFTDGEDHGGQALEQAKKAAEQGIVIYAIGIGSQQGSVIPIHDNRGNVTGYKKDDEGKVVTSRLDESTLQKIALETGGKYYRSVTGEMELKRVYAEIQKMEKKDLGSQQVMRFEDRYQFFLLPAFLLFLFASFCTLPLKEKTT
ncbi:MAG TPA: VWA domain-containing protein [Thermoanaerobaculia bacterium]|nr:VWA domain-containing protein [Thermoanaerobaculia bacterium]HUM30970.1 VWA domain-containing protein [Thermoanaerobaculia bacterium]HXK69370.1 VWA domain-containing protein [Thermoanaerobaculia bacterium]